MTTSQTPYLRLIAVLTLCIWSTRLHGATIYSNLVKPGDLYGPDSLAIGAIPVPGFFFQYAATNFTVFGQDYRLSTLELPLFAVLGPPEVDVFLMEDNGNLPGTVLEQFSVTSFPAPSNGTPALVSIPSVVQPLLIAGRQYWVAAAGGTSTFAEWALTLFAGDPVGGGATRSIQNGFDYGWVHNPGTRLAALRVSGDPVSAVPEPSTILLVGGGLIALGRVRRIVRVKPDR
jgi:hypothetical protein